MDNHIFRSALSGFNRQDVMEYIERTQKQAEEAAARLEDQVRQARQEHMMGREKRMILYGVGSIELRKDAESLFQL